MIRVVSSNARPRCCDSYVHLVAVMCAQADVTGCYAATRCSVKFKDVTTQNFIMNLHKHIKYRALFAHAPATDDVGRQRHDDDHADNCEVEPAAIEL